MAGTGLTIAGARARAICGWRWYCCRRLIVGCRSTGLAMLALPQLYRTSGIECPALANARMFAGAAMETGLLGTLADLAVLINSSCHSARSAITLPIMNWRCRLTRWRRVSSGGVGGMHG